jgi:hypothetical protein
VRHSSVQWHVAHWIFWLLLPMIRPETLQHGSTGLAAPPTLSAI